MNTASDSLYEGLVEVMERYLSRTSVESTLKVVLDRLGIDRDRIEPGHIEHAVAEAMVGLRIFCDPEKLPELMLDLADYCEQVVEDSPQS